MVEMVEVREKAGRKKPKRLPIKGYRYVGKKKYRVRVDELFLAHNGLWELSEFRDWRKGDWVSLKLFDARKQSRKRIYQLGYNVKLGRVARNRSMGVLADREPAIAAWVGEELGRIYAGEAA